MRCEPPARGLTVLTFEARLAHSRPHAPGWMAEAMILRLPKILIDQIAAGEVIVRPASVVKELIENSVDAQSRHIQVTVGSALRDIAVADDGTGLSAEDARLALERHATSKIRSLDDLQSLRTRGFRGEALPSIAAVSRLTLTTRRPEDLSATRVCVEGGEITETSQVGAPTGTQVAVRDLFFNTPARLKFMKGPATELGQMARVIVRQSLAAASVGFRFLNQQRPFLDLPADQSLESRARQLLGIVGDNLIEVQFDKYDLRVWGYIAKPLEARRDRRHQFFFVNGRPISHRALGYSVEQAYEGLIATQRYPVVVLFIELPPEQLDVNVHPTKEEVRFSNESKVNGLVHRAVAAALHAANLMPHVRFAEPVVAAAAATGPAQPRPAAYDELFRQAGGALRLPSAPYEPPAQPRRAPAGEQEQFRPRWAGGCPRRAPAGEQVRAEGLVSPAPAAQRPSPPAAVQPTTSPEPSAVEISAFPETSPPEAIAQIADTYIVAQTPEGLLLIDQHAAHERLLYLRARDQRGHVATQPLLVPISVEVRPADQPLMEELAPLLAELGFETEAFGGHTFVIRSVPVMFDHVDLAVLVGDLLDDLASEGPTRETERLRERVLTRLACHAAIKAGQHLQREEMQRLMDELLAARLSFTCPHGRPTMILLTRDQLDRQFKRK